MIHEVAQADVIDYNHETGMYRLAGVGEVRGRNVRFLPESVVVSPVEPLEGQVL